MWADLRCTDHPPHGLLVPKRADPQTRGGCPLTSGGTYWTSTDVTRCRAIADSI